MKKYIYILMAGALSLAACTTKFEEPAAPQSYPEEEARTLPTAFTVTAVESIKLAEATDELIPVAVLGASSLPEDAAYGDFTLVLDDKYKLSADEKLRVKKTDLQEAVSTAYGLKPEERTFDAVIKSSVQIDGQGFTLVSNAFKVKVTAEAPVLEEHYYYIGAANSWSNTDKTYEFVNASGKDFYEDPVVTVTIPAPLDDKGERADNWFKVAPGSSYDSDDFWNTGLFIGAAENGESAYEGKFVQAPNSEIGAFNVGPATEECLFYSITLNLLDQTYKVVAQNFTEYIYYIGNGTGWSTSIPLRSANLDGKYVGFGYVEGEFKFKPNENDWNGDWEFDGEGKIADNGGANCPAPATSGYYKIEVDLAAMTYSLSELITTIGIVGPAQEGGWNDDTDMTFNPATGAWELTISLLKDEFKFRANDAWDINWGGSLDALTQGGNNILAPDATEYKISLWAWCDNKAHATLERTDGQDDPEPSNEFGDYFYVVGGDTGWSAVYALRSAQAGGVNTGKYKGFGYLSQEFKFKPNEDNWAGDLEFDGEGKVADNGGSNCPAPTAGYYMIELDMTAMTYSLTAINSIGIIGPAQAGGWDSDTDMTYNVEGGYWEISDVVLTAGEMKFRANDAWDINWGGALDALTQGGDNITVSAGTYSIKLYALCDGKAYAQMN